MGSGKTTTDPTAPETARFDPRDFLQKASHAYLVMLDNQNTMPEWATDTLCRLVTGEADSKRRLYTADEDVIIELKRAVLLNGINVPTDRGDALDRSLPVELERIPDGERRPGKPPREATLNEHARATVQRDQEEDEGSWGIPQRDEREHSGDGDSLEEQ